MKERKGRNGRMAGKERTRAMNEGRKEGTKEGIFGLYIEI
jgi:hypothetical protein